MNTFWYLALGWMLDDGMAARNWWGKSSASLCAHMLSGVPNFNGRVYPSGDFFFL
jgi:hypothetical protein